MKLDHTAVAVACSVAFISLAAAQTVQALEATQRPYPSTESQEIYPMPDTGSTTPLDGDEMVQLPESPNPDAANDKSVVTEPEMYEEIRTMKKDEQATETGEQALTEDEQNFLENAIQGSYAEVEGSKLALEKSEDEDVRHFAQMMIEDHQTMLDEARSLAEQKGISPPDGPSVMQVTEITALRALMGGAFDAMYVNRIGVAAHESTVEMFEQASQQVQDRELREMINKTLPRLHEHLKMARTLNEQQENQ